MESQVIFGLRAESSLYLGIPRLDHQVNDFMFFLTMSDVILACVYGNDLRTEINNKSLHSPRVLKGRSSERIRCSQGPDVQPIFSN